MQFEFFHPSLNSKKENEDIRLVVDYLHINTYLIDEIIQISKIYESIRLLGSRKWFLQIYLKTEFNQLELEDGS